MSGDNKSNIMINQLGLTAVSNAKNGLFVSWSTFYQPLNRGNMFILAIYVAHDRIPNRYTQ